MIIIQNIIVSLLILSLGIFGSELFPLLLMLYNAFYLGDIINVINTPSTINYIYALIPHCIIEVPAIIICITFACNFALKMRGYIYKKGLINILKQNNYPDIIHLLINYLIKPYIYYVPTPHNHICIC